MPHIHCVPQTCNCHSNRRFHWNTRFSFKQAFFFPHHAIFIEPRIWKWIMHLLPTHVLWFAHVPSHIICTQSMKSSFKLAFLTETRIFHSNRRFPKKPGIFQKNTHYPKKNAFNAHTRSVIGTWTLPHTYVMYPKHAISISNFETSVFHWNTYFHSFFFASFHLNMHFSLKVYFLTHTCSLTHTRILIPHEFSLNKLVLKKTQITISPKHAFFSQTCIFPLLETRILQRNVCFVPTNVQRSAHVPLSTHI